MPRKSKGARDGIYQQKEREGFVIRWVDSQGRRKGRIVKGSMEEAKKARAAQIAKSEKERQLGMPLPSKESFAAFTDEFLKHQEKRITAHVVKGKLSQAEYARQKGIVELHLKPFFGSEMKLAAIRRADVVKYINRRTGVVSDGTIIKEVNVLKRMLNFALDLEKIPSNPAQRAPLPQAPEGRVRYLTTEELTVVMFACYIEPGPDGEEQDQWLQQAAGLAVSLGTRRGELMNVTLSDISLESRSILLKRTKNGKPRAAQINDDAMLVLEAMDVRARQKRKEKGKLFQGITPDQLSVRFIRACEKAGIEDFSFHDLRHTYASHLRMSGADLHDIQKLLGHSDPRMTDRYAHLSNEHLSNTAQRLNGVLSLPAIGSRAIREVAPQLADERG